jgi:mono/diheme cytochrome c family protein
MMKKVYLQRILLGLGILIIIALAVLYIWSAAILDKKYNVSLTSLPIPTDEGSIQEGARLLRVEHCTDCHGGQLTGRIFDTIPNTALLAAPNLTTINNFYSSEEMERVIRHGVKRNGTSVFFMPANMYYELKDEAVAKIIAYLKTLHPLPSPANLPSSIRYYPLGRLQLIGGKFKPRAAIIKHSAPRQYIQFDTSRLLFGKYLVMTACSNCHGKDLKGDPSGTPPNLVIASAYSREGFYHLLKTGEGGLGRKDVGKMSELARDDFRYLNDTEINDMYAFLKTLPFGKD